MQKCKTEKPEEDFPFRNKSKGIRNCVCKLCQREYKLKYYYKNKESHYLRNAKTNKKLKEYALSKKDKCIVCGEMTKICLDWHHLRDKEDVIARICKSGSMKKLNLELDKCVVLCANCHRKVHAGIIDL